MSELADAIGGKADALLAELGDAGVDHAILKTIRAVIATRATINPPDAGGDEAEGNARNRLPTSRFRNHDRLA